MRYLNSIGIFLTNEQIEEISKNEELKQHINLSIRYLKNKYNCFFFHLTHGRNGYWDTVYYINRILANPERIDIETDAFLSGKYSILFECKNKNLESPSETQSSVDSLYSEPFFKKISYKYTATTGGKKHSRLSVFKNSQYCPTEKCSTKKVMHHYLMNTFIFSLFVATTVLTLFFPHLVGASILIALIHAKIGFITAPKVALVAAEIILIGLSRTLLSCSAPRFDENQAALFNKYNDELSYSKHSDQNEQSEGYLLPQEKDRPL